MYFRNGPKAAVDIAEKRINFASPIGQAQVLPRRLRRGKSELVRNPLMFRAVSDQHMCDPTDGPQGDHLPPITKKAGPMSFHPEKKSAEVMTLRTEGLAPSYFSHALKASTGSAPYQWQLQARIQRAQALLLLPRSPSMMWPKQRVSQTQRTSRACSESSQATPSAWRKDRIQRLWLASSRLSAPLGI